MRLQRSYPARHWTMLGITSAKPCTAGASDWYTRVCYPVPAFWPAPHPQRHPGIRAL